MTAVAFDIAPFGETGWLARFSGLPDDVAGGVFASRIAASLRMWGGVVDAVAGVDSLVLSFDPIAISSEDALAMLQSALDDPFTEITAPGKTIDIPVLYGGDHGPDFDALCAQTDLSADALIEAHCGRAYRVAIIGFAPGFAYLGGLDERLRTDRLATPRQRVEAGSVGIAGAFTGVYALASPGGWRIIGRTPRRLFDGAAETPLLFSPGDEVRFTPISPSRFAELEREDA